jgi:excisionase family DNA binding protein
MPKREELGRHLRPDRSLPNSHGPGPNRSTDTARTASDSRRVARSGELSTIDALLDFLVERVAQAVVERLCGGVADQNDDWLDSREAADYLGLHRDTLRRLAAARAMPAEQDGPGCKLFFRRAALDDWRRSGGRTRHLAAVADAA